jgi:hypothetical protein
MIKVTGTVPTDAAIRAMVAEDLEAFGRAFLEGADESIDRSLTEGPATGRMYGSHQASAPGESPHEDTGKMRATKKNVDEELNGLNPHGEVGWFEEDALVPAVLDQGTRDGKIAPRPFREKAMVAGVEAAEKLMAQRASSSKSAA